MLTFSIGVYFLIGILFALYYFKLLNELIEDYEEGLELFEKEEEILDDLDKSLKIAGGKRYVIVQTIVCMIFWPMCIFGFLKKK